MLVQPNRCPQSKPHRRLPYICLASMTVSAPAVVLCFGLFQVPVKALQQIISRNTLVVVRWLMTCHRPQSPLLFYDTTLGWMHYNE